MNLITDIISNATSIISNPGAAVSNSQKREQVKFVDEAKKLIQELNSNKSLNTPACLILQSKEDDNGAFHHPNFLNHLKEFGGKFFISLKLLDEANIRGATEKAKEEMGNRRIDVLWLRGHGQSYEIAFGKKGTPNPDYKIESVSESDFALINPKGTILLESCSTGARGGIAQKISSVFKGIVHAPRNNAFTIPVMTSNNKLNLLAFTESLQSCETAFKKSKQHPNSKPILIRDLHQKGGNCSPGENFVLGAYYYRHNPKKAEHYMKLAYSQGNRAAGYHLDKWVFFGLNFNSKATHAKIECVAIKEVAQGNTEAMHRLGKYYEYGLKGFPKSPYKAGCLYILGEAFADELCKENFLRLVEKLSGIHFETTTSAAEWFNKNVPPPSLSQEVKDWYSKLDTVQKSALKAIPLILASGAMATFLGY